MCEHDRGTIHIVVVISILIIVSIDFLDCVMIMGIVVVIGGTDGTDILEMFRPNGDALVDRLQVVNRLIEGRQHVPFRDSQLTRLLMPALGGNSRTVAVCTISSDAHNQARRPRLIGRRADQARIERAGERIEEWLVDRSDGLTNTRLGKFLGTKSVPRSRIFSWCTTQEGR